PDRQGDRHADRAGAGLRQARRGLRRLGRESRPARRCARRVQAWPRAGRAWTPRPHRREARADMKFKGRREDDRLLTGQGKYTSDWNVPGQLYGYFLRSDRAHAEIVSIKVPETKAVVFTGKDFDCKTEPPLVRYPGKGGAMLKQPHRDVLA